MPVLKVDKFTGKYVIKIVVQQGEPTFVYCFSQKIQLQSATDRKQEEFEVVYSYKRINAGNTKEYKGLELIE